MYFTPPQFMNVSHTSIVKRIYCVIFWEMKLGKEKYLEREGLKSLGSSHPHLDSAFASTSTSL